MPVKIFGKAVAAGTVRECDIRRALSGGARRWPDEIFRAPMPVTHRVATYRAPVSPEEQ